MLSDRFSVILTPSSSLDTYGALLPVGIGYYFGGRYSMSAELGIPMYYVLNNYRDKPYKTVNSDYRIRTDARQYFRLREKHRLYAGAELFFRRQAMTLRGSYLHFTNGDCYTYDELHLKKSSYGTGFFLGPSRRFGERLLCEGHVGLGLRFIKVRSGLDTQGIPSFRQTSFSTLAPPNEDRVGDRNLNAYIPLALKIVYLF